MKKLLLFLILLGFNNPINAQIKLNDFGRIVLNAHIPDNSQVPSQAKALLITKLNQVTSKNGMGGSQVNPRFIITAAINVGTKDIIGGPPQLIAQNLEITLFIGDALTNIIFSNITLNLKGVGTNENKALINAFKTINPKNKMVLAFLEEGKKKIIDYYVTQCAFIIKDAQTLVKQEKYDAAIYKLTLVPEVCQECYFKCLDTISGIYQQKMDADCKIKFNEAKVLWAAARNPTGAEKVASILSTINPIASCQAEVTTFIKTIDAKLKEDEKARWRFKMKQYKDKVAAQKEQVRIADEKGKRNDTYREKQSSRNYELDKISSNNAREIAVEYAKNQPKKVTYNNIYWR